jgi:hypothetical protein
VYVELGLIYCMSFHIDHVCRVRADFAASRYIMYCMWILYVDLGLTSQLPDRSCRDRAGFSAFR